ncbi:hypothetical protein SAMN04489796_106137 [Winogradskyella thalassocola]|uniref:Uncharacterized protein n=1 Tax=Winogradskyella thalassocola TaxID=262004 RepID=A0A1G8H5M0_9FLAO|nr:hypothetical protein SAMN04489796_106137 [Winogradskyella thalassocola]
MQFIEFFELTYPIYYQINIASTMKNSLGLVGFIAILFLTFGITYLDFDNLDFGDNYKAYLKSIL